MTASRNRPKTTPSNEDRRFARRCYGHLAGALGVAVTEALISRDMLRIASTTTYEVTDAGRSWLDTLGMLASDLKPARNGVARRCLDGTERRHHLGGPLAARLLDRMMALGWLVRPNATDRTLRLTPVGEQALTIQLELNVREPATSRVRLRSRTTTAFDREP